MDDSQTDARCTDTDGTNCTKPGCEAGVCVQAHIPAPTCPACQECKADTGVCGALADSQTDPRCTDTDSDLCTKPGCEAGVCVQGHIPPPTCSNPTCQTCNPNTGQCEAIPCDTAPPDRHVRKGLPGNFHARSFDSLECACLPCPENPDAGGVVGALCNPGDRICGPEPRRAPANKICFSGPGDYALSNGKRDRRSVVFRVDVEDRSEPGGTNGPPPPDRYRMRIWFGDPDTSAGLDLRRAVACADPTTENISAPTPDIDDGGDLIRGNQQMHPPLKKTCSASGAFLDGATP